MQKKIISNPANKIEAGCNQEEHIDMDAKICFYDCGNKLDEVRSSKRLPT